jgi:Na+/melibiose symporter-like transporter
MIAYFGNYLVTSIIYKWGNSFVDPHRRGRYCATKEMISLISGMVVTLIVGYAMDGFELANNLHGGFIFAACGIAIFSICDLVCLLMIKNEKRTKAQVKAEIVPLGEVFRNTLGNKKFLLVLLLAVLMEAGKGASIGFLGTYRTNLHELALGAFDVMVINMIGNLVRFAVSRPFGKFSDKYSYAKGIELALVMAAVSFVVYAFTAPGNRVFVWTMVILFSVLYHGCQAGVGQNMHSILYSYVDSKYFVQASAIKSSVGGLCHFGSALLASRFLQYIQGNGNSLFGIHLYGQQALATCSIALTLGALAVAHFVVSKQKRMVQ